MRSKNLLTRVPILQLSLAVIIGLSVFAGLVHTSRPLVVWRMPVLRRAHMRYYVSFGTMLKETKHKDQRDFTQR